MGAVVVRRRLGVVSRCHGNPCRWIQNKGFLAVTAMKPRWVSLDSRREKNDRSPDPVGALTLSDSISPSFLPSSGSFR
ncbi:hypothetical protein J2741_001579 [Methanolinea mesophila]|nr:hypothetical protein [Methanolinea mesophila]